MLLNLAHEFYKFIHRKIPLFGISILLGMMLYTVGISYKISPGLIAQGFGAGQWAIIIMVAISSDMISMEYHDNTMATLMYKTSSRSALYTAKLIVLIIYSAVLLIFGFILSIIIKTLMVGSRYSWLDNFHSHSLINALLINMAGTMIYVVFVITLALLLILLIKNNAAVIMIGLAIAFLGASLSGVTMAAFPSLKLFFAWNPLNMINVISQLSDSSVMKHTYLTNSELIIGNLLYAAVFFCIGLSVFKKRPI